MAKTTDKVTITKASIGDHVSFNKEKHTLTGSVIKVLENSVIVDIQLPQNEKYRGMLETLEHERTVVNHRNYQIIQ